MADNIKEHVHLIKKYPNRRLYDTKNSAYITLADVKQLVMNHVPFEVVDAKTQDNLTRSILLQIILEEEAGGSPMFSSEMLAQMIRFYGHTMQGMMGHYLEKNMEAFIEIQQKMAQTAFPHYEGKTHFSPEMWTQLMNTQGPMMQNMMNHYVEQSKHLFMQMQEHIQKQNQALNLFTPFPFMTDHPRKK